MKVSQLKLNKKNPRKISPDQMEKLKSSIQKFPKMMSLRPIVYDPDTMEVLGGNQRLLAIRALGMKEIPDDWMKSAGELNEKEKREFIIRDNIQAGDWDFEILSAEFGEFDLEEMGMNMPEINVTPPDATEDDFDEPDIQTVQTDIKRGDIIEIGRHRLMCGDSTSESDVAMLMNGQKADMVLTDPPYNTGMAKNKDAKARLSHMFSDNFTEEQWSDLLSGIALSINKNTKKDCAIYVFIDWRRLHEIKNALSKLFAVKNVIVWDKIVHGLGSDYKSTYENIVVAKKGNPAINNRIEKDYQDIWRVQRKIGRDADHATKKPIEILKKPILHASNKNSIVFDLFLGSGSTMVACHQLDRICYGMEISEQYCQVIVDRMRKLDSTIEIKINGEIYV